MERALTTSWLSARLGVDPLRLDALRRNGRLLAFREQGSQEYRFPAWQFDAELRPLPIVAQLVSVARERGLGDERLLELLHARVGIGGSERLADLVGAGEDEQLLTALRAAISNQ